jgi:flavin reductase (DIM6/NTAB) family NADH-FMN oxidoreductase RutF
MKKNIGSVIALYPTPVTVVGTMVNGKTNWLLVSHVGIMGHDHIMISCAKSHYSNQGIKANRVVSVNIVDEALLPKVDYVGSVSGIDTDKSQVFDYELRNKNIPIIKNAPVCMECIVEDIYNTNGFDNFILKIESTYAEEEILNKEGKLDYHKLKPVLFEMPTYEYLRTGEIIGQCKKIGNK